MTEQHHTMQQEARPRRWAAHLLLLVTVLFGLVTMHTLGHPSEEATPAPGSPSAHASTGTLVPATGPGIAEAYPEPRGHSDHARAPLDGSGFDPTSVCLAVLGASLLTVLAAGALSRSAVAPLAAHRIRILLALQPNPPPRALRLAQLSVLRL